MRNNGVDEREPAWSFGASGETGCLGTLERLDDGMDRPAGSCGQQDGVELGSDHGGDVEQREVVAVESAVPPRQLGAVSGPPNGVALSRASSVTKGLPPVSASTRAGSTW